MVKKTVGRLIKARKTLCPERGILTYPRADGANFTDAGR